MWYRFDTLLKAQAALDEINNNSKFPITGRNAKTRLPAVGKQTTDRWAAEVTACKDGKFAFPALPDTVCGSLDILKETEEKDGFLDEHKPVVEEFDKTWTAEVIGP